MDKRPDVSVIIVSYNSLPVLLVMLASLRRSLVGINSEVCVVDNASSDGTVEYLREHYSWVRIFASKENSGFSKANNMAFKQSSGKVVLVLNPDTIIPHTFVRDILAYFEQNPDSGAVGVQMINGYGKYLRESKRGYTGISASFFKLSGLWRIFQKSARINEYYLGHIDRDVDVQVPILVGACMAFTRQLLDKVGGFDESYFMYGEDNDLSWRMHQASTGNMYLGSLNILHFKGMSTPRKLKYVRALYRAMELFARKYEFPKHCWFVNMVVYVGIKVGCLLGYMKCAVLKVKDKIKKKEKPKKLVFVSSSKANRDAFVLKNKDIVVLLTEDIKSIGSDIRCVVFDVEGDINLFLDFMKRNETRYLYGFYSASDDVMVSSGF